VKNKVILFVCRGNRFRSRLAEEIFNKNATRGFIAESAGITYQKHNDRATPKVLKEIGIEMNIRKPRELTEQMTKKASKIIVFRGVKILSIKAELWPVEDCHAGDIVCIRKGRKQIEKRVKKLHAELKS